MKERPHLLTQLNIIAYRQYITNENISKLGKCYILIRNCLKLRAFIYEMLTSIKFWKNVQEAGSVRNIKKSAFQKTIIKFYVVGNSSIP